MEKTLNLVEEGKCETVRRAERAREEKEKAEMKRKILELAFASDDEEESLKSHDSDEWGDVEQEQAYVGSDDEDGI